MNNPRRGYYEYSSITTSSRILTMLHVSPSLLAATDTSTRDSSNPRFHFSLASVGTTDLVNDPNGPQFINGRYHMFFQHRRMPNPTKIAHATSKDLLHWHLELPVIRPTPGGYDDAGVWSGNGFMLPSGEVGLAYRARSSHAPGGAAGVAVAIASYGRGTTT